MPSCGFSLLVSGMTRPPTVTSSSVLRRMLSQPFAGWNFRDFLALLIQPPKLILVPKPRPVDIRRLRPDQPPATAQACRASRYALKPLAEASVGTMHNARPRVVAVYGLDHDNSFIRFRFGLVCSRMKLPRSTFRRQSEQLHT